MRQRVVDALRLAAPHGPWTAAICEAVGAGFDRVDPRPATARAMMRPDLREIFAPTGGHTPKVHVLSVGKAAHAMHAGVLDGLPRPPAAQICGGLRPPSDPFAGRFFRCEHPEPGPVSLDYADAVIAFARTVGEGDLVIACVSGGASSMLCGWPRDEHAHNLAQIRALQRAGAPITALNAARSGLDPLKAGGVARRLRPARLLSLVLSDTPGAPLEVVGSGPTLATDAALAGDVTGPIDTPPPTTVEIAGNHDLVDGVLDALRGRHLPVFRAPPFCGDAFEQGRALASVLARREAPVIAVAGGECTTTRHGDGDGGRTMEMALGFADGCHGQPACAALFITSDGVDGTSNASGAVADGTSRGRLESAGYTIPEVLARSASANALAAIDGLVRFGPTDTNVADLAVVWRSQ